ncbi:MAG TPA: hypothetical protein VF173_38970 [Thermoanaerobaculia bacterium]|nr:hypothetical protein [Thermoanaerobaculia bacterium]
MILRATRPWMSLTLALGLAFAASASAQTYTVVDLGSLGTLDTFAFSVSDSTRIAGYSYVYLGPGLGYTRHGFLWQNGTMLDLGLLPGGTYSWATDINEAGQMSGHADNGSVDGHPILVKDGIMQDLLWPVAHGGEARGINDLTQIAGYSVDSSYLIHAAFWSQSTGYQDLTALTYAAQGMAEDLNNHTQVIGWSLSAPCGGPNGLQSSRATMWENPGTGWVATDLGTLGSDCFSDAFGINQAGHVVGNSGAFITTAALWQKSASGAWTITSLGSLGSGGTSTAYRINNREQIVGESQSAAWGDYHAILWQCGSMIDLNTRIPAGSGWVLNAATGINDLGEIVGYGKLNGGNYRGFLLKPSTTACCGLTAVAVGVPVGEEEGVPVRNP